MCVKETPLFYKIKTDFSRFYESKPEMTVEDICDLLIELGAEGIKTGSERVTVLLDEYWAMKISEGEAAIEQNVSEIETFNNFTEIFPTVDFSSKDGRWFVVERVRPIDKPELPKIFPAFWSIILKFKDLLKTDIDSELIINVCEFISTKNPQLLSTHFKEDIKKVGSIITKSFNRSEFDDEIYTIVDFLDESGFSVSDVQFGYHRDKGVVIYDLDGI